MHRLIVAGVAASSLLFAIDAAACRTDTDCPGGSRCVKGFGEPAGVCERGVRPVDETAERRIIDPGPAEGGEGQPCEFGGDCAEGLYCMDTGYSGKRVCGRY
jgi:hypothetical protein